MKISINILSVVLLIFFALGCGSSKNIKPGDTLEVAFEKAKNQYDRGKYSDAARSFETVLSIGRGSDIAQESQYLLAESYFKTRDYLLASSEFSRYYTNYPRSERRREAEFKEALSYYKLSPRHNLDQSDTRRSLELMLLFVSKYPTSAEAEEASRYIDEMRSKLAQKVYRAGEMYFRIKQYEAAAVYFDLTIDSYPDTRWAEQALARQVYAYILFAGNSIESRQVERYQMAITSYQKYLQLFPRGPNRSEVEKNADIARAAIKKNKDQITAGE